MTRNIEVTGRIEDLLASINVRRKQVVEIDRDIQHYNERIQELQERRDSTMLSLTTDQRLLGEEIEASINVSIEEGDNVRMINRETYDGLALGDAYRSTTEDVGVVEVIDDDGDMRVVFTHPDHPSWPESIWLSPKNLVKV